MIDSNTWLNVTDPVRKIDRAGGGYCQVVWTVDSSSAKTIGNSHHFAVGVEPNDLASVARAAEQPTFAVEVESVVAFGVLTKRLYEAGVRVVRHDAVHRYV